MRVGVVGLFAVLLFSNITLAEPSHKEGETTSSTTDSSTEGTREKAKLELKQKAVDFILPRFPLHKDYLEEVFGKSLPDAIEAMMDGDTDKIADVVAKIMGTISTEKKDGEKSQVEKVRDDAKKEIDTELEKDGEKQDKRYLALMDKFLKASKIKLAEKDEKETDEDKKFAEAYKKAYEPVRQANIKTNELINKAANGDTEATRQQALDELRKMVDVRNLPKYFDMQLTSGGKADQKRAGDILDAYTYTDPTTKKEFLTFFTKDGPEKVWFPEGKSGERSLAALRKARSGFPNWTVAADQSIKPGKISTIDGDSVKDGPPSGGAVASTQGGAKAADAATPATPQAAVATLTTIATQRACIGCHEGTQITFKNNDFYVSNDMSGEVLLTDAIKKMEALGKIKVGDVKKAAAEEMKTIGANLTATLGRVLATK